jgi:phosphotransferase system  glucose/maltose/N-acetylglucosamine-specific IIC component
MEIETTPVTLEQRVKFLKQAPENGQVIKKSFLWVAVIISVLATAGICVAFIHYNKKKKEKQGTPS